MKKMKSPCVVLLLATLLLGTSCSNNDASDAAQPQVIPFEVTAVNAVNTTRATLNSSYELTFEAGDQLAITGTGVSGTLTLSEGAGTGTAKFTGTLASSGTPAADLELTATLTGSEGTQTGLATTFADAFHKYGLLTGTSTYASRTFHLQQQSSFVLFDIKFQAGIAAGTTFDVTVSDGANASIASSSTTIATVGSDLKATFALALPGGTTLTNAKMTLSPTSGTPLEFTFGGSSYTFVKNKYYTVTRTVTPNAIIVQSDIAEWTPGSGDPTGSVQF